MNKLKSLLYLLLVSICIFKFTNAAAANPSVPVVKPSAPTPINVASGPCAFNQGTGYSKIINNTTYALYIQSSGGDNVDFKDSFPVVVAPGGSSTLHYCRHVADVHGWVIGYDVYYSADMLSDHHHMEFGNNELSPKSIKCGSASNSGIYFDAGGYFIGGGNSKIKVNECDLSVNVPFTNLGVSYDADIYFGDNAPSKAPVKVIQ